MTNITKLEDNDRYYNWYHGYSQIDLPYFTYHGLVYDVHTTATSGTITTQHFGDNFDADKVETQLSYEVNVYPPVSVQYNPNITLYFEIEKLSMKDLPYGLDSMRVKGLEYIEADSIYTSQNYTPLAKRRYPYGYYIQLNREAFLADIRKQKLHNVPGFRLDGITLRGSWRLRLNGTMRLSLGRVPKYFIVF